MTKYPRANDMRFVMALARLLGAGYGVRLEMRHSRPIDRTMATPAKAEHRHPDDNDLFDKRV